MDETKWFIIFRQYKLLRLNSFFLLAFHLEISNSAQCPLEDTKSYPIEHYQNCNQIILNRCLLSKWWNYVSEGEHQISCNLNRHLFIRKWILLASTSMYSDECIHQQHCWKKAWHSLKNQKKNFTLVTALEVRPDFPPKPNFCNCLSCNPNHY